MLVVTPQHKRIIYALGAVVVLVALSLIAYWAGRETRAFDTALFQRALFVGFIAQLVDGALGMAYGITATTFFLSSGMPPMTATASVHIAEIFTTAASGLSHWHRGNINRRLFLLLLFPGMIGGFLGVLLVTHIDSSQFKPWMAGYLCLMGAYLIFKSFGKMRRVYQVHGKQIAPLGLFAAFMDAIGGGGWGPIVTTTLLGTGHEPRTTIGSVNAAEFFITVVTGVSFAVFAGLTYWEASAGLILGGFVSAPLAVFITSRLKPQRLMLLVGLLITGLSAYTLWNAF